MTTPTPEGPTHRLNAFDLGCVVVGGIIGVGIFFTPASVAAAVDEPYQVVLAWGLGGMLAILGALVFAALAVLVPGNGGHFRYILKAFGPFPAFLYGWANWLVIQAGALGIVGVVMADYLDKLAFGGGAFSDGGRLAVAVVAILLFTLVNALGLRVGKGVQNLLTVVKIVGVFGLVVVGTIGSSERPPLPTVPPEEPSGSLAAILAAAILPVLFSFGGWQQGAFLAGAAKKPKRDVPIGIIGGVIVVVIAYVTLNLSYLDVLGFEGARESKAIGADAARAALEPWGIGEGAERVFAGIIVVSALGIMNTICMAPPYVLHAMAQEGVFPKAVGRLHGGTGAPVLAVLGQGVWAAILLLLVGASQENAKGALNFLLNGVVFVDWVFFALCGASLLVLQYRLRGERASPVGSIAIGVLFVVASIAVTAGAIWRFKDACWAGAAVIALGAVVHLATSRRRGSR